MWFEGIFFYGLAIISAMTRFLAFIGIVLVLIGVRYYDSGIFSLTGGKLTVYNNEQQISQIFLPTGSDSYRIDLPRDFDVEQLVKECNGDIVLVESNGNIIYVYTPLITRNVWVHGKRVNMMIHLGQTSVNIGVPILKGSY